MTGPLGGELMYNNDNTCKLYRHKILLYAIDFFSQGFTTYQIEKHAFDFTNEILTLNSTAIFLRKNHEFVLHKSKNYGLKSYGIYASDKLENIARFHGNIINSNFSAFLDDKDIEMFKPKLIIPLIVRDMTLGFIISDGKVIGELDNNDFEIATALMRLINKSLENRQYAKELKENNKKLDTQIYNLFFIYQTTKTLLSELDIESIYSLCTDIIGEVACSKITTFGLYDGIKGKIILRSYRDIFSFTKYYSEFELIDREYKGNKIILNYHEDKEEIKKIFKNWKAFEELDTEYIILIVQDKIHGFITISKPVNDREYNELMFDLIKSLASIIYIAINNANLFKKTNEQKVLIEKKYNILHKLSKIIKNINSTSNIEGLSKRLMRTLNIGFGIEKGCIILKNNADYCIVDTLGFHTTIDTIYKNDIWESIDNNGITYEFSSVHNNKYFNKELCVDVGDSNCLVISPLAISNIGFDTQDNILGYIVVFKTKRSLEPEEILLINTISGSIAPVIRQLNNVQRMKKEYVQDQQELFLRALKEKLYNKEKYYIDFRVYYKKIIKKPFEEIDTTPYFDLEYYYFDNYVFVLSEYKLRDEDFEGVLELNNFNEIFEAFEGITY